tara:strand:- start:30 stop:1046 length:1017 start_codon:yes stop_codon:yes gene_type:complete
VPQSEYFASSWTNNEGTTLTANSIVSPEGVQNAFKLVPDATNAHHRIFTLGSVTAGNPYTYSVFAKKGEYRYMLLRENGLASNSQDNIGVDLETGTITYESFRYTDVSIEDYGNGWYRISASANASLSSYTIGVRFQNYETTDNGISTFTGNGTSGGYVYGFQAEAGSYATSYIPTYGTSVTRNADIFKVNNIGTNNLITNDAFTLFIDIASVQDSENSFRDLVAIFGSKNFRLETRTSGQVRSQQIGMVTSGDNFNSVTIGTYNIRKFAFTFTTTQCKMYVDGALHSTYNGVYTHDFNVLSVRNSSSLGAELKIEYRKVMLFPTALTEQEAITLTTI